MKNFLAFYEMAMRAKELKPAGDVQGSSHEISKYTDKKGNTLYVKFPEASLYDKDGDRDNHILVEYLAYKIYETFGIKVPSGVDLVIDDNDRLGLASGEVRGKHPSFDELKGLKDFVKGFAVDAFLANWDVSGTGYLAANIIVDEEGNTYRIDPGGALTFRARGGAKGAMFTDEVGEVDTLRDPKRSTSAESYNNHKDMIKKSFDNFLSVGWPRLKKELTTFNNEKIVKEISAKMSPEKSKQVLSSWQNEFNHIIGKLGNRYESMKRLSERMES